MTSDSFAVPVPNDRSTLLALLGVRNSQSEAMFDAAVHVAAQAVQAPVVMLSFMDEDTVWMKARLGWPTSTLPLHDSLCKDVHTPGVALQVDDLHTDPRYRDNPLVRDTPHLKSYTGVPVTFRGLVVGTLSVLDVTTRRLPDEALATLFGLGTMVTGLLDARLEQWRRRQEQTRSLDFARISGDWLWETDAQYRYVWLGGDNFARKTGIAPHTFLGRPPIDGPIVDFLGRPLDPPKRFTDLLKRRERFCGVIVSVTINGRHLLVARAGEPRYSPSGEFMGFRGSSRDVTAAVRDNQALQAAFHEKQVAQQASEAKTRFLAEVSHEVRTPLNAVLGFTELMTLDREHPLPAPQQERLTLVRTAAGQLLSLVNDMLELARVEQGRPSISLRPLALEPPLRTALDMVRPAAQARGIALRLHVPAELLVQADPRALNQVLLNLLSNAVKYNRPGEAVDIQCEAGPDVVEVRITDRGLGLTAEQQAQLFQPFNRLGAQHGSVVGSGLGLVISKSLAEAMGGGLALTSQPGEGTTAVLRLRRSEPAAMA